MKASDARLLSNAEALLSARLVKVEEALLGKEKKEPELKMRKEETEEVKVRQVPILMEDGRRVVHKKTVKNGDSSIPNLSADFQKDIEDFVQKRDGGGRSINGNGFTKRIFFQSTEEIEEVTSRSRRGPSRPRGWTDKENGDDGAEGEDEDGSERQSRRSLPPEAGVRDRINNKNPQHISVANLSLVLRQKFPSQITRQSA